MISIDSNILIWGVKRVASAGQEDMIVPATAFFEKCCTNRAPICITTPALAEFLVKYSDQDRAIAFNRIQTQFIVAPFDAAAAMRAAELHTNLTVVKEVMEEHDVTRQQI